MPIIRFCKVIVRPLVKPAFGVGFTALLALFTLQQVGVSVDDIRRGQLVPTLMSKVLQQSGVMDGMGGIDGLDSASMAGMMEQVNLGDPGGIQAMLRTNGSLREEDIGKPGGAEKPRGVVIFSPDGPGVEPDADEVDGKPAPIVRVHRREAS